jgi:hypothetical protein
MNCNDVHEKMVDLLFEVEEPVNQMSAVANRETSIASSLVAEVQMHLDACASCSEELTSLRSTMALLDEWKAPAANPYFLTRLNARLAEERAAEPAGWAQRWFGRLRARVLYGSQVGMRPVAAMALTVMVLVGGGAYLGVNELKTPPAQPVVQAAVVDDLQTLDNNAQILDQLESMSDQSSN